MLSNQALSNDTSSGFPHIQIFTYERKRFPNATEKVITTKILKQETSFKTATS